MSRPPAQEREPSCLDQFKRAERGSDRHPSDYAPSYHSFPPLPVALAGDIHVKEAMQELERQNKYLRALVVRLSEMVLRQVTVKK